MYSFRRKLLRGLRLLTLRSIIVAGLLPKLLIPIGFMPAALADGGPITLCDGYGWLPPTSVSAAPLEPGMHGVHAAHAARAGHATPAAVHDESASYLAPANPIPSQDGADNGHGDEHEQHDQWERCAFAGMSSSTPLGTDWQFGYASPTVQSPESAHAPIVSRTPNFNFRPRAPPQKNS